MMRSLTVAFLLLAALTPFQQPRAGQDGGKPRALAFAESQDPRTLDPHLSGDVLSARHSMLVYEALLEFDPFEPARLRPCIAAEMPVYDAQKLTYTFKLRDDVSFADDPCFKGGKGRKVVAADMVYSFKRLAALPRLSNYWIIEGRIEGLDEFRTKAIKLSGDAWRAHMATEVAGLSALDERTFVVRLTQPYPQFLYANTMSYLAVLAREACDEYGEALGKHPVGTGPYVLKEWKPGSYLEYVRNPGYRDIKLLNVPAHSPLKSCEGMRLPLSQLLRFDVVADDKAAFSRFLEGEFARTGLGRGQAEQVLDPEALAKGLSGDDLLSAEAKQKGFHLQDFEEPLLDYIAFNMDDEIVGAKAGKKGRAIRQALALCIDRQRMILEHRAGRGRPADKLVPPGVFGHGGQAMVHQRFDAKEARSILRNAGFQVQQRLTKWRTVGDDGKQVTLKLLLRGSDEDAQAYAKFISECAEQAGVKVICEQLTFAEFLRLQDEGKGQAYDAGWIMDYPDAENLLQLLYGPNKPPGVNAASFENAEFDKCFTQLAKLDDQVDLERKRKLELIARMTEIVDEETPWIFLNWRRSLTLYHDGVKLPPPSAFNYALLKYTVR